MEKIELKALLSEFPPERGSLLPVLREVNEAYGYVSEEAVDQIADYLRMTANQVFGTLTFYSELRTKPAGERTVKFCVGPACYLKGIERIERAFEQELGVPLGDTTPDGRFTLEPIHCNGACAQSPMLYVDDTIYTKVKAEDASKILEDWRQ
ncbi:MAG: NAD(P)H-dependent oxidoreductase subunit E [Dehalococcoidia bacterium]|nr:NAD(P)H-dependent oxidoreductase subunit E [Dehalococcoidia bacterium]